MNAIQREKNLLVTITRTERLIARKSYKKLSEHKQKRLRTRLGVLQGELASCRRTVDLIDKMRAKRVLALGAALASMGD